MKYKTSLTLRLMSAALCAVMLLASAGTVSACAKEDPMVLVREEYSGLSAYSVEYTYNAKGQLTQKVERENQVTDYTYYADGTLKQEILRIHDDRYNGNIRYSCDYRKDGTIEKRVDNAYGSDGNQTGEETVIYDSMGYPSLTTRKVFHSVANSDKTVEGKTTAITNENTYDEKGRIIHSFQTSSDSEEMIERTWWYDGESGSRTYREDSILHGRLFNRETTITNSDGKTLVYLWDTKGQYPIHHADYYLYDDHGNLMFHEHSEHDIASGGVYMGSICGSTTHYTNIYKDGLLQQTLKTSSSYQYNGAAMEESKVPEHTAVRYEYDSSGRMTAEIHKNENDQELYRITWEYDAKGNLIRYEDPEIGTVAYTYAPLSSLKTK